MNLLIKLRQGFVVLFYLFFLMGCDDRGELVADEFQLAPDVANSYLSFLNPQSAFSQDVYQLIVLPSQAINPLEPSENTEAGYRIDIINLSASDMSYQGNWDENTELNWALNSANSHALDLRDQGLGLDTDSEVSIQCTQDCELVLAKSGFVYNTLTADENFSIQYSIQAKQLDSLQYAQQYYKAVDPDDERTTLADWQKKNGFDQGHDVHVIFRDSKDLGYGRDMYARKNDDGSLAIFVNNFVVTLNEADPDNYGPLNLFAAVYQDFEYHLGSNAIEFSPIDPADPSSDKVLKFFTFSAKDEEGVQHRLTSADLDGRGLKHMPSTCLTCHGGNLLPLNADTSFNHLSLKSAKLNQLEVNSFEFKDYGEYSQSQQALAIKQINQWVRDTYAEIGQRELAEPGRWDSSFVEQLANGRYGGEEFSLDSYQEDSIPPGWQQTDFRPEGVENLYLQVIEPHCISCHSLRGYSAGNDNLVDPVIINGESIKLGNAINFSSYEKFISYSDLIIDYVYRRGVMPLSLRNAEVFWQPPYSAPALLANFLPAFDVLNDVGEIQPPGLPVARLESQRLSAFPVRLNGKASYFANSYQWQILSGPEGHDGEIESPDLAITNFTGSMAGQYEIALTVTNSRGTSSTSMMIEIDANRKLARELNFVDDIKPLLQNQSFNLRTCQSCHNSVTGAEGVPVYYDDSNENLYQNVRSRVNLVAPMDSLLLQKPTRRQHGGGIRFDLDTLLGEESYNTILQWINLGAPCGLDINICP
jgi:mono/diheme cytochrome c family protein